ASSGRTARLPATPAGSTASAGSSITRLRRCRYSPAPRADGSAVAHAATPASDATRDRDARPLGTALRFLNQWFRLWGFVAIGLLATTALALLVDAWWRLPFALAHL